MALSKQKLSEVVIPNVNALRVVRVTSVNNGYQHYMEMHDDPGVLVPISLIEMPDGPIKNWSPDEFMVVNTPDGKVSFGRHTMGGPVYPVARKVNPDTGRERNVRVTMYAAKADVEAASSNNAAQTNNTARTKTERAMAAPSTANSSVNFLAPPSRQAASSVNQSSAPKEVTKEPARRGRKPKLKEADFPVPNKADFASFGEYMSACRKRKADMRGAGLVT